MDFNENLSQLALLGLTVSVKTIQDIIHEGEIYYYGGQQNLLILKEKIDGNLEKFNFRLINSKYIKEIKILSFQDMDEVMKSLTQDPIDLEKSFKQEKFEYISSSDKKFINELTKHYKIQLKDQNIELCELGVFISPPYGSEDCKGNEKSLPAVKKFISTIKEKLATQNNEKLQIQ